MAPRDLSRLRSFIAAGGWTDGLFDRNWAIRMEREGWLRWVTTAGHGERQYEPTEAAVAAVAELTRVEGKSDE